TRSDRDWSSDVCSSDLAGKLCFLAQVAVTAASASPHSTTNSRIGGRLRPSSITGHKVHEIHGLLPRRMFLEGSPMSRDSSVSNRSEERRVGKECRSQWR